MRVCVDLNVFVAAELAARRGKVGGLPQRVLDAVESAELALVALGTGPHADKDARVVEAALADRADYLVTSNIADFLPAATPHPVTGRPPLLGVQLVRPYDLALALGWPLGHPA